MIKESDEQLTVVLLSYTILNLPLFFGSRAL